MKLAQGVSSSKRAFANEEAANAWASSANSCAEVQDQLNCYYRFCVLGGVECEISSLERARSHAWDWASYHQPGRRLTPMIWISPRAPIPPSSDISRRIAIFAS